MPSSPRRTPPRADATSAARRHALARGAGFAAALLLGGPMRARAQAAFDLVELMRTLAQVKAGEAQFVERRTVAMLDKPLESSGRLSFAAPDTFVRETSKPRRERLAVVGNELTMSLGGRTRTVPLDSVPEAAVIMEAIRGTLTGNRDAVERHFTASVSGDAQRWSLQLTPREARLRESVSTVRLSGLQATVREVVVTMPGGDRSVMTIDPASAPSTAPSSPAAKPASAAS